MSSTDTDRARALAADLFDTLVKPLAESRGATGREPFCPQSPERGAASYYETPTVGVMRPADFEFPGGGASDGLIDALAARWTAESEPGLAAMAPALKQIADALSEEAAEGDGTVSILCYTMF
jgi:hypothetical protein